MNTLLKITALIFLSIPFPCLADNQAQEGITLFNQYKPAEKALRAKAASGDPEVLFYLAESIKQREHFTSAEAVSFYEASAEKGNIYAMIKLGRLNSGLCATIGNCPKSTKTSSEWMSTARKQAQERIDATSDSEAMYLTYEITRDSDWLKRSAENGYALAEYWMALRQRSGEDFFLTKRGRESSIENWFKRSAEHGYPKAMLEYAAILLQSNGDLGTAQHWIEESASTGYESGVSSYGAYLSHEPDTYAFPLDLVKGHALITLLRQLDGGGNIQAYVKQTLPKIEKKMTSQQIEESLKFADAWRASHPPLSFFPEKLGYQ